MVIELYWPLRVVIRYCFIATMLISIGSGYIKNLLHGFCVIFIVSLTADITVTRPTSWLFNYGSIIFN